MKYCIFSCRSNYEGTTEYVPAFSFPDKDKEPDLRRRWTMFVNRVNWESDDSAVVGKKHFEQKYMKTGKEGKRYCLIKSLKPVPTILNPESEDGPITSQLKAPVSIPWKSPKKCIFQEEQLDKFLDYDIKSFTDFDTLTPLGYTFTKCNDHIVYYQMEINELSVPEVTGCIRVDRDLHAKRLPLPLLQWFRYERDCRHHHSFNVSVPLKMCRTAPMFVLSFFLHSILFAGSALDSFQCLRSLLIVSFHVFFGHPRPRCPTTSNSEVWHVKACWETSLPT